MKYIGEKELNKEYITRYASYSILLNDNGEIALAYIKHRDMYNLIGGKIEDNEDEITSLKREALEEIGYDIKNVKYFDKAGSYYYLDFKDLYVEGISSFYIADIGDKVSIPTEETHELLWMDIKSAIDILYFDYHKYILRKYLDSNI